MRKVTSSRRDFIKLVSVAGGGLIVGVPLSGCATTRLPEPNQAGTYQGDAFIQITPSNEIHFYMGRSEMGQGTFDGLTTLVAEELNIHPSAITTHHAPVHKAFVNSDFGVQGTGGSTSMKVSFLPTRQSAANARQAILLAAAEQLDTSVDNLRMSEGNVYLGDKAYPYGTFAELASNRDIPTDASLKAKEDFQFIGKSSPRIDGQPKSTGTAEFGIDVDFPGLKKAILKRCPVAGGTVKAFDDKNAKNMPGVLAVVVIENGVAVVADNTWQAKQAAEALKIQWNYPELKSFSSEHIKATLQKALDEDHGEKAHKEGNGGKGLTNADNIITAEYWAPYLAHATMEPMNCTARIENGVCDVWVGCQSPQVAKGIAKHISGLDDDNVHIHSTFMGGGFGRRGANDYITEAVSIAKAARLPVQLVWTREDDMQHDLYRPPALTRFSASIDDNGLIDTYAVNSAGPNITPYLMQEALPAMLPGFMGGVAEWAAEKTHGVFANWMVEPASVEGLFEDYDTPNKEVRHVTVDPGVPLGYWRAVGHSFSGFFKESFIDELAISANRDPVQFRLDNTANDKKLNHVIRVAADKANWGTPSRPGTAQGFAAHTSFLAKVAQVAEVSVSNDEITVHKVVCVIDCGQVVNPDTVKAQMEGSIIFGLTAALHGQIDIVDGVVQQSNFHNYPMLRMPQSPEIEVHIIDSEETPVGVGEPGLPPIAAAVANGVYAAIGKRLRSLPLTLS
ncbi:xanthine dehydrogenase family protein molybdopterin-binding subunit [Maricurvus nonylphenolicus]|uniref:xanthine dehydrogenase family protein molybdopterin-binding subunit n=1 Tax=Maricurvus nonylphenolicus TaxID=1008307 RepID=UPI0036F27EDF